VRGFKWCGGCMRRRRKEELLGIVMREKGSRMRKRELGLDGSLAIRW